MHVLRLRESRSYMLRGLSERANRPVRDKLLVEKLHARPDGQADKKFRCTEILVVIVGNDALVFASPAVFRILLFVFFLGLWRQCLLC